MNMSQYVLCAIYSYPYWHQIYNGSSCLNFGSFGQSTDVQLPMQSISCSGLPKSWSGLWYPTSSSIDLLQEDDLSGPSKPSRCSCSCPSSWSWTCSCLMPNGRSYAWGPCTLICTDLSSAVRLRSAPWHMSFGEDGNRPSLSEPRRAWEQTTDEREQLGREYTFEGNKGHCGFWWWWGDDIGLVEGLIIASGWLTPGFIWVS